jgi:hypothetical protein
MRRIDFDGLTAPGGYESSPAEELSGFPSALEMILPPAAIPLIILLLLVAPIVLLTAESLFTPLISWAQLHLMSPNGDSSYGNLPNYFFLKLAAFVLLSFLGGFQLILRIKSIYYTTWARSFPRPHSLHVDYEQDSNRGMISLIQWKLYQVAFVMLPPLGLTVFTVLVALLELYLFNTFSELTFIAMSAQLTIELFVSMMLGLFTFFAFLNSGWTALTSLFGDVVAVTEPDLANSIVMQRCGRIAFSTPLVYLLFPTYLFLLLFVVGEIIWLIEAVDIHEFISFQANTGAILLLELTTLAAYIGFNYFKFYTYHLGLGIYYRKLPPQLKECFSPPP